MSHLAGLKDIQDLEPRLGGFETSFLEIVFTLHGSQFCQLASHQGSIDHLFNVLFATDRSFLCHLGQITAQAGCILHKEIFCQRCLVYQL